MSKEIEEISIGKDVEPITETQPPLVIDLPEGKKMVVGKLDPDTVIEVATWRGTGRPDSRTNRLMLGVDSNSTRSIENQAEQSPVNQSMKNSSNESSHQINTGIQYSYAASTTTDEQIKQIQGEKNEKKSLVSEDCIFLQSKRSSSSVLDDKTISGSGYEFTERFLFEVEMLSLKP